MTIITKGMGLAYKFLKPKVTNAIGKVKKQKINKLNKKAAGVIAGGSVAAAGAGAAGSYMSSKSIEKRKENKRIKKAEQEGSGSDKKLDKFALIHLKKMKEKNKK